MSLFDRLRREIPPGTVLRTPVRGYPFRIKYEKDKVVFFKNANEEPFSKIPRICWDGIPEFLRRNRDWVRIGPNFGPARKATLQEYLDGFWRQGKTHSSEANHVASVLEHLGVVEIDRSRPSKVRLIVNSP